MYSLEERLLAVKTYYEIGKNAKATVRRLGYYRFTTFGEIKGKI